MVHTLSVSKLTTEPVAADLEELLGAVERAGEEEPGEGEGERADVLTREDDELALGPRHAQPRGLQRELQGGVELQAGRGSAGGGSCGGGGGGHYWGRLRRG